MDSEIRIKLPESAAECVDLREWMELVLGMTQTEAAAMAGLHQSRISAVVCGHLPRRKLWAPLLRVLRLERQEHEFYRMIMVAKRRREKSEAAEKALRSPISETEPLLALTVNETTIQQEVRAAG